MTETKKTTMDGNRILVVDDEKDIRDVIKQAVEMAGYECLTAGSGGEALEILDEQEVDLIITDVRMPGMDGIELTRQVKARHGADVIVMTAYAEGLSYENVIEIGASDFVQKPVSPQELLVRLKRVLRERNLLKERNRADQELQISFRKLNTALEQTVNALTITVEMRDPYTSGHQRRVTQICCAVAEEMGLSEYQMDGIRIAGLLHDIGKISVPSEILSKPGRLTRAEFTLLKDHPQVGYEILKGIEFPWPVAQIMLQHHERIDGSGYPSGLSGEAILLEAKILCVADVVEAMSSHRPYRPALGIDVAMEEISKNKGIIYEPEVADACSVVFRQKEFTLE
ncbi:HD domain-containing phosphohydrolase [Thermodesulfobacteriota bacterium]